MLRAIVIIGLIVNIGTMALAYKKTSINCLDKCCPQEPLANHQVIDHAVFILNSNNRTKFSD